MDETNTAEVIKLTLHNGDEYVGVVTQRTRSQVRMTLTSGELNVVPTWSIATVEAWS